MLISLAARRGWIMSGGRQLATLAVAIAAFAVALAFDTNGFLAAFVAGIAFGAMLDGTVVDREEATELLALGGELLALVVWFLFGATLVPVAIDELDGRAVVYALASLTVIRMLPVALSLVRSGLDRPSVVFIGWFGPRGLASVVFALLAIEELGETSPEVRPGRRDRGVDGAPERGAPRHHRPSRRSAIRPERAASVGDGTRPRSRPSTLSPPRHDPEAIWPLSGRADGGDGSGAPCGQRRASPTRVVLLRSRRRRRTRGR